MTFKSILHQTPPPPPFAGEAPPSLAREMAGAAQAKAKPVNPNWAELQKKLNIRRPNPRPDGSDKANPDSVLGKRKERSDEEPEVSPLIPTSSDFSLTKAIAMDCEMVGVSSQGNKSALGRISLVNEMGNVVYDEFVRPMEYVVDFRSEISGIQPHNLKKAKDFQVVQKKVAEMLKGRILVGHALKNDLKVLMLKHPKEDMRDTSEFQLFQREGGGRRALRKLAAEILGVNIQQKAHCSIEDARATMLIYQKHRKKWEKNVKQSHSKGKHKKKGRKNKQDANAQKNEAHFS